MRLSIPPNTVAPTLSEVEGTIARLQREVEGTSDEDQRAILLHEIAVLEELGRDDHGAARDWLAAVNTNSTFREPLEQLIALIERRRSIQNLGKLLDRLGRVANSEPEAVRAQLARGDFLTDHRTEPETARAAYEMVLNSDAQQPLVWLSLQYLAGKASDAKLQERALAARIELADDATYRNLLRLSLAAVQERRGRQQEALESLELASTADTEAKLPALLEQERLARQQNNAVLLATSLERQFLLLSRALEELDPGAHTQDKAESLRCAAADAAMRVALCHQSVGAFAKSAALLEQATLLIPGNDALTYSLLTAKELLLDFPAAAILASQLLRQGGRDGSLRAALALRAANLELSHGEAERAMACLDETLRIDPQCIAARALQLNLLQQTDSAAALGFAYESIAGQTTDGGGRARHYLLAALSYAESGEPVEAAKAALSQATAAGTKPRTAARLGRLLANLRGNARWHQESTERLLRSGTPDEIPSAMLELARLAMLRGDAAEAFNYLGQLGARGEGAWTGLVLASYFPLRTPEPDPETEPKSVQAIQQLAQQVGGPLGSALLQCAAYRDLQAGRRDKAERLLTQLHETLPADPTIAVQLATCVRQTGNLQAAAKVLGHTAQHQAEPELALPLLLEAGVLHWRSSDRETAVRCFEAANQLCPAASASLAQWSLCCARPDAPDARRRALDSALGGSGDRDAYAIERFALEVGLKGQAAAASLALGSADEVALGEEATAVKLACALWPDSSQHSDAIRFLEGLSPAGAHIAHAARYYAERSGEADPERLFLHARAWAQSGSLSASLELLAAAVAQDSVRDEIAARKQIASHLTDEARAAVLGSAAMLQSLHEEVPPELLEGTHPQSLLTNLELAPPGASPRVRARALADAGDCLGEDNTSMLQALAAYNDLAAGQYEAAFSSFQQLSQQLPDDLFVWEGLRAAAASLAKREAEAESCVRLGALCQDSVRAAEFYRHAAAIFGDELQDPERSAEALERAVALDITNYDSFDAWFRLLRAAGRNQDLVDVCTRRIQVTNAPKELTRLYWERARAQRSLGLPAEALSDLESVRALEPDHVGARALAGEIHIAAEDHARAAVELTELARLRNAPSEQRQLSGSAAIDLYLNKLNDLGKALEVLRVLQDAGLNTLGVEEHLARAAATADRWEDTATLLERLMSGRDSAEGRIQAARLALAIYRDRLRQPGLAENAARCLLTHLPTDGEAIDLVLKGVFPREQAQVLLTEAKLALFEELQDEVTAEAVARLARIAEFLDDLPLRHVSLGALVALGVSTPAILAELSALDARSEPMPRLVVAKHTAASILHPIERGPYSAMLRLMAPELVEILGPTPKSLGLGRQQRRKPPEAAELRGWVAAYAGALHLGDFDLYVGGTIGPYDVASLADARTPALVFGEAVTTPLKPPLRAKLAAHVLGLVNGTSLLLTRDPSEVAALLIAACHVCDLKPTTVAYTLVPDFERLLRKHLSRRTRKELMNLAVDAIASDVDPLAWAEAARCSLDRVALIATGDVSQVLLDAETRGSPQRDLTPEQERRMNQLIQFGLSLTFIKLREQLGMTGR